LPEELVGDRRNWTIPWHIVEIKRIKRIEIGPSQPSQSVNKT
jgi:hypothetical protein